MKLLSILTFIICLAFLITCCTDYKTCYAFNWSKEIKEKILSDANIPPDSTVIDTLSINEIKITTFKRGVILKQIFVENNSRDTIGVRLLSKDQMFSWAKGSCGSERHFYEETIAYGPTANHHDVIGLSQSYYCNGNLKEKGFVYNGLVGIWEEYDSSGKLLKRTDYGNMDKLDSVLHQLRY